MTTMYSVGLLLFTIVHLVDAGFHAEYFVSTTNHVANYQSDYKDRFKFLQFEREDAFINFPDWDSDDNKWRNTYKMPEGFPKDYFAVHWTGILSVPETGSYTFQTVSDDGVRLWIGDNVVIERWNLHPPTTDTSSPIFLTSGTQLHIRLDFFEYEGGGYITLKWLGPNMPLQLLGDRYVASSPNGFSGEYFLSNRTNWSFDNSAIFSSLVFRRKDTYVNFQNWETNWNQYQMPSNFPMDYFAVRWTGMIVFPFTGQYRFQTVSDDGVRLYVNNSLLINRWDEHSTRTDTSAWISFSERNTVPITVEFFEKAGEAVIQLLWEGPSLPLQPLGGAYVGKCGNSVLDELDGEQCDGGIGCSSCMCVIGYRSNHSLDCQKVCGNGQVDLNEGEDCDGGLGCVNCTCSIGFETTLPISIDCKRRVECGNNRVDDTEECDGGMGCTECICDTGYRSTVPPSFGCEKLCGNGELDWAAGERCDGGTACRNCQCDDGFESTYPPSLNCQRICGNYHIDNGEDCDGGVGCLQCHCLSGYQPYKNKSIDCEIVCGNRRVDIEFGEECDGGTGCQNCACADGFLPTVPPSLYCVKRLGVFPTWAIVLIIFGVLLFVLMVAMAVWRRRWRYRQATKYSPQINDSEGEPTAVKYVPMQDYTASVITAQPPPYSIISEENSQMLNQE